MRARLLVLTLGLVWPSVVVAEPSGFDAAIRAAKNALRARDYDAALDHCREAEKASDEGKDRGTERSIAALICGDAEMAKERYARAARHYRRAAHLVVDNHRLRQRANGRRKRALSRAKNRAAAATVGRLPVLDQRLRVLLRYPKRSKKKAAKAIRDIDRIADAYRADRDFARVDLAKAARALVMARSGQPEEGIAAATPIAKSGRTTHARRVATQALYYGLSASEDVTAALDAAIRFNGFLAEASPEEKPKRYVRSRELDEACRRYEEENDSASCAARQLKVAKMVWLTDFARLRRRRGPLSSVDLAKVHGQTLPWLRQCVLDAARADPERFEDTDLSIGWAVGADGIPSEIYVKPSRYESDLSKCLTVVVPAFRYPRVRSQELSTVSVPYRLD